MGSIEDGLLGLGLSLFGLFVIAVVFDLAITTAIHGFSIWTDKK